MISSLWRTVMRSDNETELDHSLATQITEFMVRHYEEIMSVPQQLRQDILSRIDSNTSTTTVKPMEKSKVCDYLKFDHTMTVMEIQFLDS